ncbi:translation elongation factor Ts [Veillonella sp.]|uniref:translation elongation factor Ts n=1 Tax=Veillonella sp. TaxID=1926307 RepID=UPI0025E8A4CF|nr:translation elongation factor Ts [Veillonella sp.]
MAITAAMVKELREMTGAGMMDCKKALTKTEGDMDAAVEFLRENGLAKAAKKAGRIAAEGLVAVALSDDAKEAAIVEVNSETDFVAKTEDFQALVKDIAMQIAAANPAYLNREEVPAEVIEHEKAVLLEQAKAEAEEDVKAGRKPKPQAVLEKMVNGRVEKFYKENCLMEQVFIKDGDKTITDVITEKIAKIGENINVRRFVRYALGEGIEKRQDDFEAEVRAAAGQ